MTTFFCLTCDYKLCQQLLGTVPIAKLGVFLQASMPRSCYVVVDCFCLYMLQECHKSRWPYSSMLTTLNFHCTCQWNTPNVWWKSDPAILFTDAEGKAQRWELSCWGCVYIGISWAWTVCTWTYIKQLSLQGSNLCLISPGRRLCSCTNNSCTNNSCSSQYIADLSSLKTKIKVDIKYTQNVLEKEGKNTRVQLVVTVLSAGTFTFFLCQFWSWG